jgi:peptidoglycan/xylan/chitin deacetylase (PgdA/CDA1 family)
VIAEKDFRSQLTHLRDQRIKGVNVSSALESSFDNQETAAITFDDGCRTDLVIAAPFLKEHNFGATFFIVAGFVNRPGFLNAKEVRELAELGFEIGCHSMNHAYLTELDARQLRVELVEAKDCLEQMTGRPVDHFSCPGGRWNQRVARMAQEVGYVSLATSRVGTNSPTANRFGLARVALQRNTAMTGFAQICRGRGLSSRRVKERMLAASKTFLGNRLYEKIRTGLLCRT